MHYFDTSALIKQYFLEPGSETVRNLLKRGAGVFTAALTYFETHAAFARRKREGILSPPVTRRLALRFDKDWESYEVVLLTAELLSVARRVLYRHPLRSADALQLASALLLARKTPEPTWMFVCADQRLCRAASAEGLEPVDVTVKQ